eukprot:CAMPEP_0197079732 /NCGR_PEP_ID=MMETSP1384-20130603/213774_1 /TAXON_ID=29189 /ORGANISM="Ammonia sp." /LENGTH=567 /DNA_ID=CAMNT_0042518611 /DNA_START=57 /DNA_END=1760 /DNA_ORIENTATION=-
MSFMHHSQMENEIGPFTDSNTYAFDDTDSIAMFHHQSVLGDFPSMHSLHHSVPTLVAEHSSTNTSNTSSNSSSFNDLHHSMRAMSANQNLMSSFSVPPALSTDDTNSTSSNMNNDTNMAQTTTTHHSQLSDITPSPSDRSAFPFPSNFAAHFGIAGHDAVAMEPFTVTNQVPSHPNPSPGSATSTPTINHLVQPKQESDALYALSQTNQRHDADFAALGPLGVVRHHHSSNTNNTSTSTNTTNSYYPRSALDSLPTTTGENASNIKSEQSPFLRSLLTNPASSTRHTTTTQTATANQFAQSEYDSQHAYYIPPSYKTSATLPAPLPSPSRTVTRAPRAPLLPPIPLPTLPSVVQYNTNDNNNSDSNNINESLMENDTNSNNGWFPSNSNSLDLAPNYQFASPGAAPSYILPPADYQQASRKRQSKAASSRSGSTSRKTEERQFECGECHKRFKHASNLKIHLIVHTDKALVCEHCHKKFARKTNLAQHLRVHTGEKPFQCPQCGRKFKQGHSLKDHIKIHTGERPHKCPQCPKTFKLKHNLTMHERTHTEDPPFKCPNMPKNVQVEA